MQTKFARRSPEHVDLNGGNSNTATEVMNRILLVAILALGMGFAGPAVAKNIGHKATGVHAINVRGTSAFTGEVRVPGLPEPTYIRSFARGRGAHQGNARSEALRITCDAMRAAAGSQRSHTDDSPRQFEAAKDAR
jgi:hypothetical protein